MRRDAPKDPSEMTLLYAVGIYVNPGMARLLVEYLRKASKKYKQLKVIYLYWWPDVTPDPFVDMMRNAGIDNLEVFTDHMMASPQFGAKLGWKGASIFNAIRYNWKVMRRLAKLLRRENVDMMHLILTEYQAHYLLTKAARMAGVPHVVLSFTGVAPPNTKKKRYFNRLTDRMLNRVITASEIDRTTAAHEAFPTAGTSICRGFGLAPNLFMGGELHPEKIRGEFNIPDDAPVIGTTTRVAPGKGQDHLLKALPKVIEKIPDLRVFILGGRYDPDQPYTGELKDIAAKEGITNNLIFTGERNDAPDIFANYMFAVHLPDYDHLPFGILECGALGIPTVATSVGGIPEIISNGETGILVDNHEPSTIADAISSLLADGERAKSLGGAMRKFVMNRFNLDALVDRVRRLYKDMLNGKIKDVYE